MECCARWSACVADVVALWPEAELACPFPFTPSLARRRCPADAPRFEVHRLVMADSGTLLLCSVDHTANLAQVGGGGGSPGGSLSARAAPPARLARRSAHPQAPSSHTHTPDLQLRKRLRHAFPGGPPKQSTIVHASIARLLTPKQLTREQIDRVQVRGAVLHARRVAPAGESKPSGAGRTATHQLLLRPACACSLAHPAGGVRRMERAAAGHAV